MIKTQKELRNAAFKILYSHSCSQIGESHLIAACAWLTDPPLDAPFLPNHNNVTCVQLICRMLEVCVCLCVCVHTCVCVLSIPQLSWPFVPQSNSFETFCRQQIQNERIFPNKNKVYQFKTNYINFVTFSIEHMTKRTRIFSQYFHLQAQTRLSI